MALDKKETTVPEIIKPTSREYVKLGFNLVQGTDGIAILKRGDLEITKLPSEITMHQLLEIVHGWLEVVRDQHIAKGDWSQDWGPYLQKMGLVK